MLNLNIDTTFWNKTGLFDKVKIKDLKPGDLFIWGYNKTPKNSTVFVKYSDHIVCKLRKDPPNVIPLNGPTMGHHCTMHSETDILVYKNPKNWYN